MSHIWLWCDGLVAMAVLVVFIRSGASTPSPARQFGTTPSADDRTTQALQPLLRDGWSLIGHLLFGPAGTFALESRQVDARAHVEHDMVALQRDDEPVLYLGDWWAAEARESAARASALLDAEVSSVVVLWTDFDQRVCVGHNVTFVRGCDLVEFLTAQAVLHAA